LARIPEEEREVIRQSAESSAAILPRLERQREALNDRIDKLRMVIQAWEAMSGKRLLKATNNEAGGEAQEKPVRGQVATHIDAILQTGGDFEEPELRTLIADRFHIQYRRSTVYSALRRGLETKKYEQDGKRWRMNKKEGS